MNKELFIEILNSLNKQDEVDSKCSEAFRVILPSDYISCYDNSILVNQLLKILKIDYNDDTRDSWIDYFVYELDFGKKYKEGSCTYKDGTFIDLSTSEALWNFLELENAKQ